MKISSLNDSLYDTVERHQLSSEILITLLTSVQLEFEPCYMHFSVIGA